MTVLYYIMKYQFIYFLCFILLWESLISSSLSDHFTSPDNTKQNQALEIALALA